MINRKLGLSAWYGVSIFVAGWLFAAPVHAGRVVMKNGDQITGEIQEIWDNDIIIEPEYDDDTQVAISLDNVAFIESDQEFEVELADGRSVTARLTGRDENGSQVMELDGEKTLITLDQLEELDKIADYYDWDSRIDFSFSLNKGNTDSLNTKLYADTNLKLGDHRQIADLTITREEQDRVKTRDTSLLRYNYNWLFGEVWFLGAAASAERDPIRDLDNRFILGVTIGRDIWDKPRRAMNFQIGFGYLTEQTTPVDELGNPIPTDSNQSIAALWQYRFRHDFFGDDLEIYHNNSLNVNVTGRRNTIVKTVTGIRYSITDLLYLNTALDFDYETEPAGTATNEDLALVIGFGMEF